jgi:hypothetical protein
MKINIEKDAFYRVLQMLFDQREFELLFDVIGQNIPEIGVESVGNLCNRIVELQKKEGQA